MFVLFELDLNMCMSIKIIFPRIDVKFINYWSLDLQIYI